MLRHLETWHNFITIICNQPPLEQKNNNSSSISSISNNNINTSNIISSSNITNNNILRPTHPQCRQKTPVTLRTSTQDGQHIK